MALRVLRRLRQVKKTPVLMLTARTLVLAQKDAETQAGTASLEEVQLDHQSHEALDDVRPLAEEKGVRLEAQL